MNIFLISVLSFPLGTGLSANRRCAKRYDDDDLEHFGTFLDFLGHFGIFQFFWNIFSDSPENSASDAPIFVLKYPKLAIFIFF